MQGKKEPIDQVVVRVHRAPDTCTIDLPGQAKILSLATGTDASKSFTQQFNVMFFDGEQDLLLPFSVSGQYTDKKECVVNVETTLKGGRKFGSVTSFTPLLGVGRETALAPGNMATFTLTKAGELIKEIAASTRPEVFATKYQPRAAPTGVDDWDKRAKEFLSVPPPPEDTWWEKNQKWWKKNKTLVSILVGLWLIVVGVRFM